MLLALDPRLRGGGGGAIAGDPGKGCVDCRLTAESVGLLLGGAGARGFEVFAVVSLLLAVDGPMDALVETEEDELPLVGPERRGGGGGGTFGVTEDGDEDRCTESTGPSSEIVLDRSEAANGFGLRLCLRDSGGGGALRFCGVGLACMSGELEWDGRLATSTPMLVVSVVCPAFDAEGRAGSGLSALLGVAGDVGVGISGDVVVVELANDNVESSKDTVCGPFAFTSLP